MGLIIRKGDEVFEVKIVDLASTRGPAREAQQLYEESEASRALRESQKAELRAARAGYSPPETKPDKRARRLIRALGDMDAM